MFIGDPYFFAGGPPGEIAKINGKNVAIILKNGQTSIRKFCEKNNHNIRLIRNDFADWQESNKDEPYVVDVYIRDPVRRYLSALTTIKNLHDDVYGNITLPHTYPFFGEEKHMFVDPHIFPQYWTIVHSYIMCWSNDNIHFRLNDFNSIGELVGNVHENQTVFTNRSTRRVKEFKPVYQPLNKAELDTVERRYYFDIKIHENLLGKTLNYKELMTYFANWVNTESPESRKGWPRWAKFIEKHHPKNFEE